MKWPALLVLLVAAAVVGWLAWPESYTYGEEIVGWLHPEHGLEEMTMQPPRDGYDYADSEGHLAKGYFPVTLRTRTSGEGTQYAVWMTDEDDSAWSSAGFWFKNPYAPWQTGGPGGPYLRIAFPEVIAAKRQAGEFGALRARVLNARWKILPPGSKLERVDGKGTRTTKEQVAALFFSLEVHNRARKEEHLNPYVYLTVDNELLHKCFLLHIPDTYTRARVKLKPGEKRTLSMATAYQSPDAYAATGGFVITDLVRGWRFRAPAGPMR